MIKMSSKRLQTLEKNFTGKKIAVIGDMMLDSYYWGAVKRISPEAPVPVVEVENEFNRFGGAANVALNIARLGGVPYPIGVIGYDNAGSVFSSLLEEEKIESSGLITDDKRPTTAKTRVIAHNQHVLRIDKESKEYTDEKTEKKLFAYFESISGEIDGIILQDYNKGVLTPSLIKKIISLARKRDLLITVDPKFNNFFEYKNVTVFKPNRKEASDVLGTKIRSSADITAAGNKLLSRLHAKYILLTLGEEGIAVFEKGHEEKRMPTKAIKVADVSGAGDTVISTLTLSLAAGANILESCYLANYAAGIVCGEVGIVPIERKKLFSTVEKEIK
ncbi:MAG: D-glycero-beta-D-manno-heptose-7-phosphate kinase [Ignavibacteriaceae bacterium]